jgi:hypothetical protein
VTRHTPNWLQQGSYSGAYDRDVLGALWPAPASSGCAVTTSSGMVLNVASGRVAVPTQNNTGSTLCSSDAVEQVTITAAPPSGQNRYDLVICRPRGNDLDGGTNNDFIFDVVAGTPAATPTIPATPAGTVVLAQVYVPGGSAAVTQANIADVRPGGLTPGAASVARVNGRIRQTAATTLTNASIIPITSMAADPAWPLKGGMTVNNNGLRVPVAGLYHVSFGLGSINGTSNATMAGGGPHRVGLAVNNPNGNPPRAMATFFVNPGWPAVSGADNIALNANDTLYLWVLQTTGGALFCDPAGGNQIPSYIAAHLIDQ